MTEFQFVAALVAALAWPLTVLVLVAVFRRPLLGLLEKLRQFEGWGLKASFGDKVEKLAEDTARATVLGRPVESLAVRQSNAEHVWRQAAPEPRTSRPVFYGGGPVLTPVETILQGWIEIERALQKAGAFHGLTAMTSGLIASKLAEMSKLRPETLALIEEARGLRDSVMHARGPVPDLGKALLYFSSAQNIAKAILRDSGADEGAR